MKQMEKFSAMINSIIQNPEEGFDVSVTIYNENEFELLHDVTRNEAFNLNAKTYAIHLNGNALSFPEGSEIHEVMEVFHAYEFSNNLNPKLRRQWKTGSLIDEIAYRIFSSGILDKICEDEVDGEEK
jgi:hypothetical protein